MTQPATPKPPNYPGDFVQLVAQVTGIGVSLGHLAEGQKELREAVQRQNNEHALTHVSDRAHMEKTVDDTLKTGRRVSWTIGGSILVAIVIDVILRFVQSGG